MMNPRPILLLFTIGCAFLLNAQNDKSYLQFLYKINLEQAKTLHLDYRDSASIPGSFFEELIDSSRTGFSDQIKAGEHYLLNAPFSNYIQTQYIHQPEFQVHQLDAHKGLALVLLDKKGHIIKDARLYFGKNSKKTVPFDQKKHLYYRKNWCKRKDHQLIIEWRNQLIVYQLTSTKKKKRKKYSRFRYSSQPLLKNPINWFRVRWHHLRQKNRYRNYKGYVALNKPVYRPHDTLFFKAFLTDRKGRPLRMKLLAQIHDNMSQRKTSRELVPERPGVYKGYFLINDSLDLQLDQHYSLVFLNNGTRLPRKMVMAQRFYYEDYQLDEANYFMRFTRDTYYSGDSINVAVSAFYENGLPVMDAHIRMTVRTKLPFYEIPPSDFWVDSILIADTLWTSKQALLPSGKTRISIPDSILPQANMRISVHADITTSNGELQQLQTSTLFKRKPLQLLMHLSGSNLIVSDSNRIGQKAKLILSQTHLPDKNMPMPPYSELFEKEHKQYVRDIILPHKEPIKGHYRHAQLYIDNQKPLERFDFHEHHPMVYTQGTQDIDSFIFIIHNPRKLNIYYELFEDNHLKSTSAASDSVIIISDKVKGRSGYRLKYNYLWAGVEKTGVDQTRFYKKQLNISIEQEKTIEPGETIPMEIKVTDYKGRPANKVELVAGAINSQFNQKSNYTAPRIPYKKTRKAKQKWKVKINNQQYLSWNRAMQKKDVIQYQLQDSSFYRIAFPENGLWLQTDTVIHEDPFYREIAQFVPFLVKQGHRVPIFLIYCNNKLVYYHDVHPAIPYCFIGRPGQNSISLRTHDKEYIIDDVYLKKGHRTMVALDVDKVQKHNQVLEINKPANFSTQERNAIRNSILVYRKQDQHTRSHFIQDNTVQVIPSNRILDYNAYRNSSIKLGPFSFNHPIRYVRTGAFRRPINYKPNFLIDIQEKVDRLYEYGWDDLSKSLTQEKQFIKPHNQMVDSPKDVIFQPSIQKLPQIWSASDQKKLKGNAFFQFQWPETSQHKLALIIQDSLGQQSYLSPHISRLNLKQGTYQFSLLLQNGDYYQKKLRLYNNNLLYYAFKKSDFVRDSSHSILQEHLEKDSLFTPEEAIEYIEQVRNFTAETHDINYYNNLYRSSIRGRVSDENGDPIAFGNVALYRNGRLVKGTTTDYSGAYLLTNIAPAQYDLEVSYVGYAKKRIEKIPMNSYSYRRIDFNMLSSGAVLSEIQVTSYRPLFIKGETSPGGVVTREEIRSLGLRRANAISAHSAGLYDRGTLNIRGNRTENSFYYIDGIRVNPGNKPWNTQNEMPLSDRDDEFGEFEGVQLRKDFRDYAYWKPDLITDRNGRSHYQVTFPDNTTLWQSFVLGMDRNERAGMTRSYISAKKQLLAKLAVPRFLLEGDQVTLVGTALNYTQDSLSVQSQFLKNDAVLSQKNSRISSAKIEKSIITAETLDSIEVQYLVVHPKYSDGELRKIPVLRKGVNETTGTFHYLTQDTILELSFDREKGPITIRVMPTLTQTLFENIEYLMEYPHGCAEQTASKLQACLLAKKILSAQGRAFDKENYITEGIERLEALQQENGAWGWWRYSSVNDWMTTYVIQTLHEAKKMGYKTAALTNGLRYLTSSLERLKPRPLLDALLVLSETGQNLDYEKHLTHIDTSIHHASLHDQMSLIRIRQLNHLPYQLDSIEKHRKGILYGETYWHGNMRNWYNNTYQLNMMAYQIYHHAGDTKTTQSIKQFLLGERKASGWLNTKETAQILATVFLTDIEAQSKVEEVPKLSINGETIEMDEEATAIERSFPPEQLLRINKKGIGSLYISAFQTEWIDAPKSKRSPFELSTSIHQKGKPTMTLQARVPATMQLNLKSDQDARYVMIALPIPAGCSYLSKDQTGHKYRFYTKREGEVHREYHKDKVLIFCEKLPKGDHQFHVKLEPRFTGQYHLNPAKAEEMYFPLFFGRNSMKKLTITD